VPDPHPDPGGPLLVCLNDGWDGEACLADAAAWSEWIGEAPGPVFVYVLAGAAPRPRQLRRAERALADAERDAAGLGLLPRVMLVRAASVPAGVALASRALGGHAVLMMRASNDDGRLLRLGLSVVELTR
jgi:hypothetical protein